MSELTPEMHMIKENMKRVWSAGDFGEVAKIIEHEGAAFIDRLNIKTGSKVLDVACGTGNLAIPAAKHGAYVTGLDLVEGLINQAKERAEAANLNIKFDVGDAESLPYNDNEFDYVVTMYGAMFAPRPDVTLGELLRVCKPGGIVAMANWTPEGHVGTFFKLGASYAPPPPGVPSPLQWGIEDVVRQRFGNSVSDLKMERFINRQILPMLPAEAVEFFIKFFGPTKTLYSMLDENKKTEFKTDLIKVWTNNNISKDGNTIVDAEYLQVVAVKK